MTLDNNAPETLALMRSARRLRKARNYTKRRLTETLEAQLREIITQDFEKIIAIMKMGGLVRVSLDVAMPEEKVVNADAQTPPEPPIERETPTGNKIILLD